MAEQLNQILVQSLCSCCDCNPLQCCSLFQRVYGIPYGLEFCPKTIGCCDECSAFALFNLPTHPFGVFTYCVLFFFRHKKSNIIEHRFLSKPKGKVYGPFFHLYDPEQNLFFTKILSRERRIEQLKFPIVFSNALRYTKSISYIKQFRFLDIWSPKMIVKKHSSHLLFLLHRHPYSV